ncbi:hypothetical protein HanXRQr2_Chr00c104g0833871 [Helianthus annuus]|uniref:Uncharacterized protein n=1 Tax=Helianthus annuus TaxID=4232 RepID=A0A9K3P4W7_HELAN|nr:hypothetical protein HanXRQr2_Chr00c104g0833871 [Helianthus annuus]
MIEQHNKKFQLKVTGEKLLNLMLRFNWRRLSAETKLKSEVQLQDLIATCFSQCQSQ